MRNERPTQEDIASLTEYVLNPLDHGAPNADGIGAHNREGQVFGKDAYPKAVIVTPEDENNPGQERYPEEIGKM